MRNSQARVRTENASRYLGQLCKHFSHKVRAQWDETSGTVFFAMGNCSMKAAGDELFLQCEAEEQDALETVKQAIHDHLVRFAWREGLTVEWSDEA